MNLPYDVFQTRMAFPSQPYLNRQITIATDSAIGVAELTARATVGASLGPKSIACFFKVPDNFSFINPANLSFTLQNSPIFQCQAFFLPYPGGAVPIDASSGSCGLTFVDLANTGGIAPLTNLPIIRFQYLRSFANQFAFADVQVVPINFEFDQVTLETNITDTNPAGGSLEIDCGIAVLSI